MSEMEKFDDYLYYKKDLLGQGAFAMVFKGKQVSTNIEVAIKAIHKKNITKTKLLLQKEIKILKELSNLKHENLVTLLDCKETNLHVFLVMEFCNGGDLGDYLFKEKTLDEPIVQHFFKHMARALEAINTKGIVHRDLKPQNILLCYPPNRPKDKVPFTDIVAKLADFGFARTLAEGNMAGTLCGSPMYMAPEVIMSLKYDAKADLWSIGTIMYQCLFGKAPFVAQTPQALKNFYERNNELQPNIPPSCSDNLRDLLLKLLKRNAVDRIEFADFFNHRFLHEPIRRPSSRRLLEQMSHPSSQRVQSPTQDYSRTVRRINSEQQQHHLPSSHQSNLVRPASVARAIPNTYSSGPLKRRPEVSRTAPRNGDLKEYKEYVHEQPPRPPKSHQNTNQMTESGEYVIVPAVGQQHNPRPISRQSSATSQAHEGAIKNVHVHSQQNARAVPVPSQRGNFALMEMERQKEKEALKQKVSTIQEHSGSSSSHTHSNNTAPNFDDMQPRIEEIPVPTKFILKEPTKSRLPSRSISRLRKPSTPVAEKSPNSPERQKSPVQSKPELQTKPTVDNIRYLSTSPARKSTTPLKTSPTENMKPLETDQEQDDELDDEMNFQDNIPYTAGGLSVESSDSQMVDSVDESANPSTSNYNKNKIKPEVPPTTPAHAPSTSKHYSSAETQELDKKADWDDEDMSSKSTKAEREPHLEAPPELEDETLLDEEHKQVLSKLKFVLELTETLIGVAESNGSAISLNIDTSKRIKDPSTDAYRRAEQLVLYVKVMHIISSSLVMAQRHRDSATLQPSPAVQHVLNQLNDKYHQCLTRSQELASLGIPSGADPTATIVSAERIMYQHAIEMCQSAALDELYGNPHLCPSRYKRAYMMLHTLSEQVQSEQDRSVLAKYKDAVEKRLRILENQGYVIAVSNK